MDIETFLSAGGLKMKAGQLAKLLNKYLFFIWLCLIASAGDMYGTSGDKP